MFRLLQRNSLKAAAAGLLLSAIIFPGRVSAPTDLISWYKPPTLEEKITEFLKSKDSPLADHTAFLLTHRHWKLLIALSAAESSYCKRKLYFNCFGIGGDSLYRHYNSYEESIVDANRLMDNWQNRGRWLTVTDMNGSYVQPYNPNWERAINETIKQIDNLITK